MFVKHSQPGRSEHQRQGQAGRRCPSTLERQTVALGQARGHGNWDRSNKPVTEPAWSPGTHFCLSGWVSSSRLATLPLGSGASTTVCPLCRRPRGLGEEGVQDSSPRWLLAAKASLNQSPSLLGCLPGGKVGAWKSPLISCVGHFTIWCWIPRSNWL